MAQELLGTLENFYHARHVRLTILVDKATLIRDLIEAGFELAAYLPAWCPRGRSRYDCVLMVRGRFEVDPADNGLRDVIELFRHGFSQQ